MTLQLLSLSGSPFGWKVQLGLAYKGLPHTTTWLSSDNGDLKTTSLRARNPHGKLPVLVDGDFVLYESDAIVDYVAEAFDGPALWPRDVRQRARARRIAAEASSYLYPPIRALVAAWGATVPSPAEVHGAKDRLRGPLGLVAAELTATYFAEGRPTGADFAVYPLVALLGRLHGRRPDFALDALVPGALSAWSQRIESLPFFDGTYPPHWRA